MTPRWGKSLYFYACFVTAACLMGCKAQESAPLAVSFESDVVPTVPPSPLPSSQSVLISWQANREKAVNAAGGGYKVYYSKTAGFTIESALAIVNVPYQSGALAPRSVLIPNLSSGNYYLKVIAYSALSSGTAASLPSQEVSIHVP